MDHNEVELEHMIIKSCKSLYLILSFHSDMILIELRIVQKKNSKNDSVNKLVTNDKKQTIVSKVEE